MSKLKKHIIFVLILFLLLIAGVIALKYAHNCFMKKMYPLGYSEIVTKEAAENDIDPALVYSVIKVESNFNSDAKSSAGAIGLMQLTPDTFEWLQTKLKSDNSYTEQDLYTPEINIRYGCKFLSILMQKYGNERTALCAYNAGIGTVNSWLKNAQISSDGCSLDSIPYKETRNYASAVEKNYQQYEKLYDLKKES